MNCPKKMLLLLAVACLAAGAIGCNDTLKRDYAQLQQRSVELERQNREISSKLSQSEAEVARLADTRAMDASSAQTQLVQAQSRIRTLEAQLQTAQTTAAPRPVPVRTEPVGNSGVGSRTTLSSDVAFTSGRATLTSAGKAEIAKLASDIKSKSPRAKVQVYGHTDGDPISRTRNLWEDNLDLSANRAMAVTRELIAKGVSASNIETIAMGASSPVASNSTADGKAKNRRVEIVVLKQ